MIKDIDPHRISLALAILYVIGLGFTAFALYSLHAESTGFAWTWLIITSLLGGASLTLSLRYKKEIIVFKEKSQATIAEEENTKRTEETGIDLSEIKRVIDQGGKEASLNGLKTICKQLEAGQGAFYLTKEKDGIRWVELIGGFALSIGESTTIKFDFGEGLIGQSAAEGKTLYIDEVPEGYMKIASGLGMASPRYLFITPLSKEGKVIGVMELSTFKALSENQRKFIEEAAQLISAKA